MHWYASGIDPVVTAVSKRAATEFPDAASWLTRRDNNLPFDTLIMIEAPNVNLAAFYSFLASKSSGLHSLVRSHIYIGCRCHFQAFLGSSQSREPEVGPNLVGIWLACQDCNIPGQTTIFSCFSRGDCLLGRNIFTPVVFDRLLLPYKQFSHISSSSSSSCIIMLNV